MAQCYSNILRLLFLILVFAPIAPLSSALGVLALVLNYWTDKILLLRRHSRPRLLSEELSEYVVAWLPLIILAYATSNFVLCYHQPARNRVAPSIAFGIAILYWLLPVKLLVRRRPIEDNAELKAHILPSYYNDYSSNAPYFTEDYARANPVTAHQGWSQWLELVEAQLSREQRDSVERRSQVPTPPRRTLYLERIHDYAVRISAISPTNRPIRGHHFSTPLLELVPKSPSNPFPASIKEEDTARPLAPSHT